MGQSKPTATEDVVLKREAEVGDIIESPAAPEGADDPIPPLHSKADIELDGDTVEATGVVEDTVKSLSIQLAEMPDGPECTALLKKHRQLLYQRVSQAEHFGLKAIQAQVGAALVQGIDLAPNFPVDAAYVKGTRLKLVEVRYVFDAKQTRTLVRNSVSRVKRKLRANGMDDVDLVLAVVVETERDVLPARVLVADVTAPFGSVEVHVFALESLRKEFGPWMTPAETDPDWKG